VRLRSVVWTDPRRIFESLPLKTEDGAVVLLTSHSCWTVGRAANPVLTVMQLDDGTPSTILGGVREVVSSGMYPLAALVFFASVALPMLKLVGLTVMLVATQTGRAGWLSDRTRLYHAVRWIGRWSMIDIFMEALLGALVRFRRARRRAYMYRSRRVQPLPTNSGRAEVLLTRR
jgi:Paraquat-inducible protein A